MVNDINQKTLNQNEARLEKIAKISQENCDLVERLTDNEIVRKKLMEKNNNLEKDLKRTLEERKELEGNMQSLKKRLNDLTTLKSTSAKLYEDKIKRLQEKIDSMTKDVKESKDRKQTTKYSGRKEKKESFHDEHDEEVDILEKVQAKPYLFGPVDKALF